MKITFDWLKNHLDTKLKEDKLLEQLTNIGLEVESVENLSAGLDLFKVAKILKTEKHPNADRLKVCDVDVGEKEIKKVVCGAPNAREGLITIYAPPGAVVPKSKVKLVVAKIRDVISYGMLCSESELNLSDESDGIGGKVITREKFAIATKITNGNWTTGSTSSTFIRIRIKSRDGWRKVQWYKDKLQKDKNYTDICKFTNICLIVFIEI